MMGPALQGLLLCRAEATSSDTWPELGGHSPSRESAGGHDLPQGGREGPPS